MFSRYVSYVDTAPVPAFLWSRARGITRANPAAREWTDDLVQGEVLSAAAEDTASTGKAQIQIAAGAPFLLLPLIDPRNRTDFVVGIANADFGDVPLLLHELHENLRYFSETIHLLPQAVLTARPEGTFDYASKRWYQVTGASPDAADVVDSLHDAAGKYASFFEQSWANGVAGGELFAFEMPLQTTRGSRWFEFRAVPSYEKKRLHKWIVTVDDVHERVESRNALVQARTRLAALAEIGTIAVEHMSDTQQVERSLAAAAAAVDSLWCATFMSEGTRTVVTHPPNAALPPFAFDISDRFSGIVASRERWFGQDPRPILRAPLDFGESSENLLVVAGAPGASPFDEFDIDFVRDVAWRVASALRNARIHRRESRIARVLQTAMLPVALPRAPGISFDVSYTPAETENLIGGDWYDAFDLRDGRLAFSIGDVAGHGLDAAVIMGHVREIVRALALRGATPSEVLEETNGVVLAGGYGLITAIVCFLDPSTLMLEYASAGHAPPLRVDATGHVETLELGDVILGAASRARFRTHTLRLRSECALVLYTDGLVEFARDAALAEARMHELLSAWGRDGFKANATEIAGKVLDTAVAKDDAAMLIARVQRSAFSGYVSERRTPARSAADSRS
ncbi:MAG: serine/threonine-protein phosphatase [Candidatus Eremiobacteraeota bacterium]|nr:serine/threonine-protein phosphatase [Candidatus Eremiobacteraeota bacterium]